MDYDLRAAGCARCDLTSVKESGLLSSARRLAFDRVCKKSEGSLGTVSGQSSRQQVERRREVCGSVCRGGRLSTSRPRGFATGLVWAHVVEATRGDYAAASWIVRGRSRPARDSSVGRPAKPRPETKRPVRGFRGQNGEWRDVPRGAGAPLNLARRGSGRPAASVVRKAAGGQNSA